MSTRRDETTSGARAGGESAWLRGHSITIMRLCVRAHAQHVAKRKLRAAEHALETALRHRTTCAASITSNARSQAPSAHTAWKVRRARSRATERQTCRAIARAPAREKSSKSRRNLRPNRARGISMSGAPGAQPLRADRARPVVAGHAPVVAPRSSVPVSMAWVVDLLSVGRVVRHAVFVGKSFAIAGKAPVRGVRSALPLTAAACGGVERWSGRRPRSTAQRCRRRRGRDVCASAACACVAEDSRGGEYVG